MTGEVDDWHRFPGQSTLRERESIKKVLIMAQKQELDLHINDKYIGIVIDKKMKHFSMGYFQVFYRLHQS